MKPLSNTEADFKKVDIFSKLTDSTCNLIKPLQFRENALLKVTVTIKKINYHFYSQQLPYVET